MTIDGNEARRALADIHNATERSSAMRDYAAGANYLIVGGLAWIVGGSLSFLSPVAGRWAWIAAIVAAGACSVVLGLRAGSGRWSKESLGKAVAMMLVMAAVCAALTIVLDLRSTREAFALQALIVAGLYMAYGVWRGARMLALGFALGVAALIGWYYLRDQFELVVGVAGGALLVISGLWLRKA